MNAIGKRRLLKLADFLETKVPAKRFDMDYWGQGNEAGTPHCNTAACALGWASAIPSLHKAGVRLASHSIISDFVGGTARFIGRRVFGMDDEQFTDIFAPPDSSKLKGRGGAKVVARRIRKLVAASKTRRAA